MIVTIHIQLEIAPRELVNVNASLSMLEDLAMNVPKATLTIHYVDHVIAIQQDELITIVLVHVPASLAIWVHTVTNAWTDTTDFQTVQVDSQ